MIRLYNWGEPLLNKDLLDMIHYAGLHVIDIKISTNLSMKLEDSRIEELLRSGLKIIYISCNGISENTYRKYHVGGDLTLVMENMKRFIQIKKRLSNCHTKLVWLFHVFKHNEHEVEKAQEVAGKLGIKIKISNMRTDMGKEIFETIDQARERDAAWIPNNPRFRIPFTRQKKKVGCKLPWTETVINWDGRVIPCCAVYNEKFAFGNVHENSFRQIWNNDMYVAARKEILGIKNDKKTICRTCKSTGYLHGE